jgi:hypothetical protein
MNHRPEKSSRISRPLSLVALLFAGAGLLAVALSATVWSPGEGVNSSQADILDLVTVADTPGDRFERALKHLGHEPPRAYDINGNTVYFSVSHVDLDPIEVLRRYQDEFVHQELNSRTYTTLEDARTRQARQDMLTGGIVPLRINSDYVAMGGGLTENLASDSAELMDVAVAYARGEVEKKFRAYRHIEAFQDDGARYTTVVASWSDDQFDYRKMLAGSRVDGQHADPAVPACPGCTRLQRFEDLAPDRNHVDHIFVGPLGPDKTIDFYRRALASRGWRPAPTTEVLRQARRMELDMPAAQMRHFRRENSTLSLVVYPGSNNETIAHLTLSDG